MCTLYDSIISLCQEKGIKGGRMCTDLGLSKSLLSDLKAGRKKGINAETAQKIADYFGVSVDRVLSGEDTKKAPTSEGERNLSDDDLKVAYFRGADPTLTKEDMDAMWEDAKAFRDFIISKRKKEKDGK